MARGQHIIGGGAAWEDGNCWIESQRLLHNGSQVGQLFQVVVSRSAAAWEQGVGQRRFGRAAAMCFATVSALQAWGPIHGRCTCAPQDWVGLPHKASSEVAAQPSSPRTDSSSATSRASTSGCADTAGRWRQGVHSDCGQLSIAPSCNHPAPSLAWPLFSAPTLAHVPA